jgi:hypothetical protein
LSIGHVAGWRHMASIVATSSPVILELRLVRFWQAILGMKYTLAWRLASGGE